MSKKNFEEKATTLKVTLSAFGKVQVEQPSSDQNDAVPHQTYIVGLGKDIEIEFCISCKDNDAEPPYEIIARLKSGNLKDVVNNETLEKLDKGVESLVLNDIPFYEYRK